MTFWDYPTTLSNLPANGAISAADEGRCICIIEDLTSEGSKKHTHTLPVSTTTEQLFEIVASKLKYKNSTFTMTFTKSNNSSDYQSITSSKQTLGEMGFEPGKNYVQVARQYGNKPVSSHISTITEDSGDEATTSETGWSYTNAATGTSNLPDVVALPKPPPIPPKISEGRGHARRNAVGSDETESFTESISKAASRIKGEEFKGVDNNKESRLIGLVNQAMTCYLNSLIQTLYMTPEFRNALYEWEYKGTEEEAATTIPFQLQRLFLALQTSDKQSVETTDLTKSFGWDSSEAWQQHDIQELCRVMFDALEQKFKESAAAESDDAENDETDENDGKLKEGTDKTVEPEIIKLYEGKMKDYVQCEECKNETCRNDTYLDIPITIRPFGSATTISSVMEGLKLFVQSETLDQTNQYFCEKCNKKCDAKKGLKFTSFPYLLTLQLKRFDFDYQTMHRVKLNDRMYFPQLLDLNEFIEDEELDENDKDKESISDQASDCVAAELDQNEIELQIEEEGDSSSRDSGNDDDTRPTCRVEGGNRRVARVSDDSEEGSSVDEGIDIESQSGQGIGGGNGLDDGPGSGSSTPGAIGGIPKSREWENLHGTTKPKTEGKYTYELFSVMIHSGSAVGGHYYAYIKSFDDGQWYSFNDQIVSPISQEDIEKSYGGSGGRSSYSTSFSSSTNAYMLMYRQINPDQNTAFIKTEDLPDHIKKMAEEEEERERKRIEWKEKEKNMCSIKVFCRSPALLKVHNVANIFESPYEFHNSTLLKDATDQVYKLLKLGEVGIERHNCRLIKYDHYHQSIEQSLDDEIENQEEPLAKLLGGSRMSYLFDLMMETKENHHQHFEIYKPGGITLKVFPADYSKECFLDHIIVRMMPDDTIYHLKHVLSKKLHFNHRRIRMAYEKYTSDISLLSSATQTLREIGLFRTAKVYVDLMNDDELADSLKLEENETSRKYASPKALLKETRLWGLIDRTANLINVEVILPEDAPVYVLPPSRPRSPVQPESPGSSTGSLPPLISRSPPAEVKICPEAPPGSVRSTPSSDEGVGSYDGSSGTNTAPKTAEGSQTASPRERAQPAQCLAALSSLGTQTDERTIFWRSPEQQAYLNDADEYSGLNDVEQVENEDQPANSLHLRRNSEEDEGCSTGSPGNFNLTQGDFKAELDRKLLAASYNRASPTSSLRCEDGSSDSASQTSGEFEIQETVRHQGDGAADSAGSCSTIDSTGTLCNTGEELTYFGPKTEDETLPIYSYSRDNDECGYPYIPPTLPSATKISTLPGMARPVTDTGFHRSFEETSSDYYDGRIENNEFSANEYTAESVNGYCVCAKNNDYANSVRSVPDGATSNTGQATYAYQDTGPGYLCSNCGNVKRETQFEGICCGNIEILEEPEEVSCGNIQEDPESGESMDNITPLFADIGRTSEVGAGDCTEESTKPKYLEMTSLNNLDLGAETSRQRTESSSSALSDLGWGDSTHQTTQQQICYFRITGVSVNQQKCQVLKAQLDKRTTVSALKRKLHPIVQISTRDFSIYRVYTGGQETELNTLSETFTLISNDSQLKIKHQRALRKDEHRCKIFHLNLAEDDPIKNLVEWVVRKGSSIKEAQQTVADELFKECEMKVDPEKIRLRKKCWRNPGKIFLETDVFGTDIIIASNPDIFLEILEEPEKKVSHTQIAVYCRRWRPSTLTLDRIEEVILDPDTNNHHSVEELKNKLAILSGLDAADIQWTKPRGLFPCHTSVLEIHDGLDWEPAFVSYLGSASTSISEDGAIIFYRDKNELVKELSDTERTELQQKEAARLSIAKSSTSAGSKNSSTTIRPYSRKEKALKIYTVTNNKKKRDNTTTL
uniref:ubiquitin carboxyl-terminal hydrolase 47-like n=1 Tax=Styela clava TaxID=7725 RepID=UPI00193A0F26|nr:ubiquitin carboxyl-terminal hydrolase 47-like [Styela clava]